MQQISGQLDALYQTRREIKLDKADPFVAFEAKIADITTYYQNQGNNAGSQIVNSTVEGVDIDDLVQFSGAEAQGRLMDLNQIHTQFVNIPLVKTLTLNTSFTDFMRILESLQHLPREVKVDQTYEKFLVDMLDYLRSFYKRIHPMGRFEKIEGDANRDFESKWANGTFPGWERLEVDRNAIGMQDVDDNKQSAMIKDEKEEDVTVSGDKTQNKSLLPKDFLCMRQEDGSIICRACHRMYAKETVFNSHLTGKKHIANEKTLALLMDPTFEIESKSSKLTITQNKTNQQQQQQQQSTSNTQHQLTSQTKQPSIHSKSTAERIHDIGQNESLIQAYLQSLNPELERTKDIVQRRSIRKLREIQDDLQAQEEIQPDLTTATDIFVGAACGEGKINEEQDEEDEASNSIYNPKGVPLGWDGKPIPLWLYKLNGLNQEFKCEICGNVTYKGPKDFEKHFQEWRHANGMRALRIPNTLHFHNITKIADAQELYAKILGETNNSAFVSVDEEEFEDKHGNVHKRKVYEDLKRQGLL